MADATIPRAVMRIRLVYQKLDRACFLGNRELTTAFGRASRRAGLPLAFSSGHRPTPRMSFGPALSLGFASYGEYMDIDLSAVWSGTAVMDALNRELPDGLTVVEAEVHGLGAPTIDRMLGGFTYRVSLAQLPPGRLPDETVTTRLAEFIAAPTYPIAKRIKGYLRTIDARASVTIRRSGARTLQVQTAVTRDGTLKPHHVVATIFGLNDLEASLLGVTKIGTTLHPSPDTRPSITPCSPTIAAP